MMRITDPLLNVKLFKKFMDLAIKLQAHNDSPVCKKRLKML